MCITKLRVRERYERIVFNACVRGVRVVIFHSFFLTRFFFKFFFSFVWTCIRARSSGVGDENRFRNPLEFRSGMASVSLIRRIEISFIYTSNILFNAIQLFSQSVNLANTLVCTRVCSPRRVYFSITSITFWILLLTSFQFSFEASFFDCCATIESVDSRIKKKRKKRNGKERKRKIKNKMIRVQTHRVFGEK